MAASRGWQACAKNRSASACLCEVQHNVATRCVSDDVKQKDLRLGDTAITYSSLVSCKSV